MFYLNNYFYISLLTIAISFFIIHKLIRQRRRSQVNILKLIKELEDKLIKI